MDKTENSSKGKLSTSLGRPYLSQPQAVWRVKHPPQMWHTKCVHCIRSSEVVLCPILYCIDVFSTYLGKILDFVVVHWSFIFVSHVSRLIVEFIWVHMYIIVHAFAFLDTFFLLLLLVRCSTPIFRQQSRTFLLLCSTSQIFPCWCAIFFPWLTDSQTSPSSAAVWRSKHWEFNYFCSKSQSRTPRPVNRWKDETVSFLEI